MTDGPTSRPWHRQAHQWAWVLAGLGAAVLGCLLLDRAVRGVELRGERAAAAAAVADGRRRNQRLEADLRDFQELVDRHREQKEQLVREVADFQRELDQLSRRTAGLEAVRDDLKDLGTTFAQFRQTEEEFKSNLAKLEGTTSRGPQ